MSATQTENAWNEQTKIQEKKASLKLNSYLFSWELVNDTFRSCFVYAIIGDKRTDGIEFLLGIFRVQSQPVFIILDEHLLASTLYYPSSWLPMPVYTNATCTLLASLYATWTCWDIFL